ncbi:peptidyl-prolyl cis-trans isomerase, partial [Acinetobacter junii]
WLNLNKKVSDKPGTVHTEPYRVCRRVNILRDYPDDKTKLYPRN